MTEVEDLGGEGARASLIQKETIETTHIFRDLSADTPPPPFCDLALLTRISRSTTDLWIHNLLLYLNLLEILKT